MIRQQALPGLSITDYAARFLVIAAGLSLNDLFSRAFGVGQIASPGMFLASLVLILQIRTRVIALPSLLFSGMLASYVGFGLIFSVLLGNADEAFKYVYGYLASAVIVLGIITYIVNIESDRVLFRFLNFTRNIFAISASLILASPILDKLLAHGTYGQDGRFRGVFSNPNEAGFLGVFAWILCTLLPFKDRRLQAVAQVVTIAGVVATLSKGSIVVLLVLMAYKAFDIAKPKRTIILMLAAAFGIIMLQNVGYFVTQLLQQYSGSLSASQLSRLIEITDILGGNINAETTTGRTLLWNLSLARIAEDFPMSGGLGSFHFLVDGLSENGIWQGSHNLYLMLLGEAGPIPLVLFLMMAGVSIMRALSMVGRSREFLLLLWATLVVHGLSSHASLEIRFILLILAITLGLTIRFDLSNGHGRTGKRGKAHAIRPRGLVARSAASRHPSRLRPLPRQGPGV